MCPDPSFPKKFIEEKYNFPPAVEQESMYPTFIGYTEKEVNGPIKVDSLQEFEQVFGGPPALQNVKIVLDDQLNPTADSEIKERVFKLYYSLKLFFANGGQECFIISAGTYKNENGTPRTPRLEDFKTAILSLKTIDLFMVIAIPDAIELEIDLLSLLQQFLLIECKILQNRFAILDVKELTAPSQYSSKLEYSMKQFREKIGIKGLKYGAAYYPHLVCNFPYSLRFGDIKWKTKTGNLSKVLDEAVRPQYENLVLFANEVKELQEKMDVHDPIHETENDSYPTKFHTIKNRFEWLNHLDGFKHPEVKAFIIEDVKKEFNRNLNVVNLLNEKYSLRYDDPRKPESAQIETDDFDKKFSVGETEENPQEKDVNKTSEPDFDQINNEVFQKEIQELESLLHRTNRTLFEKLDKKLMEAENNFTAGLPFYNSVLEYISQRVNTLPASGAMVGIYARFDSTSGVWKSPANTPLSSVVGLTDEINDIQQEGMNVHPSGKSINALRKFTGKGILPWGARTLDGNNADYRYINTRLLVMMIETSAKNACAKFVFEPNTPQTWVMVKNMLENFLTLLFQKDALAGAIPKQAFFVQIGLNETMTQDDILNEIMIIRMGLAPIRPGEFIIVEITQIQIQK